MTQKERMEAGLVYDPSVGAIMDEQTGCLELQYDYNATRPHEGEKRASLLKRMFAEIGENCYVEPPLHSNWGGHHVHFGRNVYANFGLTLVDDADIFVGDFVMFAPNVVVATAAHPILPALRRRALQYNKPVHIGDNVWIGAGAVILPGITIGENTVVGAGSVVTHDLPANVVAAGVPCRVLRQIGEHDREFFWRDERIDYDDLPAGLGKEEE